MNAPKLDTSASAATSDLSIPTVLVIDPALQHAAATIIMSFRRDCKFLFAETVRQAGRFFKDRGQSTSSGLGFDFDAVTVSTRLSHNCTQACDAVARLRGAGFNGPILANSADASHNRALVSAGATRAVEYRQDAVGSDIFRLIDEHFLGSILSPEMCALVRFAEGNENDDQMPVLASLVVEILPLFPSLADEAQKAMLSDHPRLAYATISAAWNIRNIASGPEQFLAEGRVPLGEDAQAILALFKKEAAPAA